MRMRKKRTIVRSTRSTAAPPQTGHELAKPLGGALGSASVLRAFVKRPSSIFVAVLATCAVIVAADWPSQSGGPQRDGWARSEKVFTRENVGGLNLLYKYQADNQSKGLDSLTSPLIDGLLITYRGFKEMLVFGGSSDNVYTVDADLNKLIWKTHFDYHGDQRQSRKSTVACPGGLTAFLTMRGSSSAGVSFGRRPGPPATANAAKSDPLIGEGGMYGGTGAFFAVGSDGYLHTLNPSTGADLIPPAKFVPANSRVGALNVDGNTIYAATSGDCGGHPNALYAIDLGSPSKKVSSLPITGHLSGIAGTAIGSDGTVYVEQPFEQGATDSTHHPTILALEAQTLGVKDSFTAEDEPNVNKNVEETGVTPLVFSWKGKDLILAAGGNGRLYLLDSTSLGGPDHRKPLFATEPIAGGDFRGGFSSWNDADTATRWVYAPFWGSPQSSAKFPSKNGSAGNGSIMAFKVFEQNGRPTLAPAWISSAVLSPAPPVTANGLVFALSTGESTPEAKAKGKPYGVAEIQKASTHATLYALDGGTGKQLYSSGDGVVSPSYGSGLAVANGRIYFTTSDNTLYAFGFSKMQPQLTDK
jgi:outer membrane protein assembly factor BamB